MKVLGHSKEIRGLSHSSGVAFAAPCYCSQSDFLAWLCSLGSVPYNAILFFFKACAKALYSCETLL